MLTPQIKLKSRSNGSNNASRNTTYNVPHNIIPVNEDGWRPGQSVRHGKFGEGVIIKLEGSGTNCRAHIQFFKLGMKVLDLNVAKLERV